MKKALFPLLAAVIAASAFGLGEASEYAVAAGDNLEVTVYDHPDLATTARVDDKGFILFPLIGRVYVGGLTVSRIADVIKVRLADGWVVDPQVTVFIREYRSIKVAVMGQVRTPGLFSVKAGTTFLEVLSRAGGITDEAGATATVARTAPGAGGGREMTVNLDRLIGQGDASLDLTLLDGDSIYVSQADFFSVSGEVRRPDRYRLEEGTTLEVALAAAGGRTDNAYREGIVVTRRTEGGPVDLEAGSAEKGLSMEILSGDRIHVPGKSASRFYVTGEVARPGTFPYEESLTVIKAVTRAGGFTEKASKGRIEIRREVEGEMKVIKKAGEDEPVLPEDVIVVPESFF